MSTMAERLCQGPIARPGLGMTYAGYNPALVARILPLVDYIEVTPDAIAEVDGEKVTLNDLAMAELKDISTVAQIIVHGVGLSIGSHEGYSARYLRLLDAFLERVEVAWHSEHLAYTTVDGEHLGTMLALPKTTQVLDMICERVEAIQQRYGVPFLLENVVHVLPDYPGEYSDAAFLNAISAHTGCGLLLDAYNLECDMHNHGFDLHAFLAELNPAAVREVHVACGVEYRGVLLDVHSRETRDTTLDLAQHVVTRASGGVEVVTYELLSEAVSALGLQAIGDELWRIRRALEA